MMRLRAERFGAWVRVDDRTLVAVDRRRAAALGVASGLWEGPQPSDTTGATRPLEVHVAITSRCPLRCTGCYQDARSNGVHAPTSELAETLDRAAEGGAFTVAFGGGEPLTHPELPRLAREARARGLVPVVTTSGIGLDRSIARSLTDFAQVNVSYDGEADTYGAVRGLDGAGVAEQAIANLIEAGVTVGVNVVLTRASIGALERTCARAAELGAVEAQLLRYKPQGRARGLDYLDKRLGPTEIAGLPGQIRRVVDGGALAVRIDCALVPLLSFDDPVLLAGLGVMGCEAGNALSATRLDGANVPCSFAGDLDAAAFGAFVDAPEEPCRSCPVRAVCRGGCKVVSSYVDGRVGPDPECPRVVAHRAARGPE